MRKQALNASILMYYPKALHFRLVEVDIKNLAFIIEA
jgi:hypothetical protein